MQFINIQVGLMTLIIMSVLTTCAFTKFALLMIELHSLIRHRGDEAIASSHQRSTSSFLMCFLVGLLGIYFNLLIFSLV